jgi:hypothetical protein
MQPLRYARRPSISAPSFDHFRQAGQFDMSNPFLKKNPFMSLWLSGANAMAGSMRGHATARAKRQVATATTKATQDVFDLWANAMMLVPKKRKTRRGR